MSSTFDTKCDRCGSTPAKRALGPVIQLDINTRPSDWVTFIAYKFRNGIDQIGRAHV